MELLIKMKLNTSSGYIMLNAVFMWPRF